MAIDAADREALLGQVADLYDKLEAQIRSYAPSAPAMAGGTAPEPVLKQLEGLLAGKVGVALSAAEWEAAVEEGNERAKRQQPPGYLDAEKADSDLPEGAAGDYLVWSQTVEEAKRRGLDVLIVTGDEKEDWWWRYRSEFLGPRVELVAEFKHRTEHQLYMMRPIDLLRRASALDVTVRSESVDDVERVSRETQPRPEWTSAAVSALLEQLETEGWSQADVIREAAAHGGTIDREEVYQICGYDDDRMLRGFTLPTIRITRALQLDGVVADGVAPVLTTIYRGGTQAAAFRIPAEMVTILTTDQEPNLGSSAD